jgi:transcription elongation factor Elf1
LSPYIKLDTPIIINCPKCSKKNTVVSTFFSKDKEYSKEGVYFCSDCNTRIRYIIKYSGQNASLELTEVLDVKVYEISIKCLDCNTTFSRTYDWYDYDSKAGEKWNDEICMNCGTFNHVNIYWDSHSIKILETDIKEKWKWEEYYSMSDVRGDCFFLEGSDQEAIGDDNIGFLSFLDINHGISNQDEGGFGGIGGSDRWEEYCPFLDGGFVRMQGNWENPDSSNGLTLEGIWIFGINAFRYVCYVENLNQPELYGNELTIPTFSDLCRLLNEKKNDKNILKEELIDKLYGIK